MNVEALIFDFDGTLLDTETPTYTAWRDVYKRHGESLEIDLWEKALGSFGQFDPWLHLQARLGAKAVDPQIRERVDQRILQLCLEEQLRPGVVEVLDSAKGSGVRLAVASSSSGQWVHRWLARHRIRSYFEAVITRDDVERVKPAPDLFLAALRRLGARAQRCLVIEDSPAGVVAAREAGIRCIAVPNSVSKALSFPGADLVLPTLAGVVLSDLLEILIAEAPRSGGEAAELEDLDAVDLAEALKKSGLSCVTP